MSSTSVNRPLYVGYPNLLEKEHFLDSISNILDSRRFTNNGPYLRLLEERIAEYLGVKHVITVCNATIGLMIASKALELAGEVILPSFTFIASAHSMKWQGLKPIFCDINPTTHNVSIESVKSRMTQETCAIMGVHVWGRACDTEALESFAKDNGIKLFYDAAHAFGCTHNGKMIGGFGECEVFSFHATKSFHTFEGGAITTNNNELAETIREMINFGFKGFDNVISLGINAKMSELHAAMGLANLDCFDRIISENKRVYNTYKDGLAGIPGIKLMEFDRYEKNNFHYIVIEVDEAGYGMSRDELYFKMHERNIFARRYFYPGCSNQEPYKSLGFYDKYPTPHTDTLCKKVMLLPNGIDMTDDMIGYVCKVISSRTI